MSAKELNEIMWEEWFEFNGEGVLFEEKYQLREEYDDADEMYWAG
jgi:hypothetical protein